MTTTELVRAASVPATQPHGARVNETSPGFRARSRPFACFGQGLPVSISPSIKQARC